MTTPVDEERGRSGIYQRLDGRAIRLLSIKPGYWAEPIECELQISCLDTAPAYEALSYCWGPEGNPESMVCNGVQMSITQSLADALKHMRRSPEWDSVAPWPESHPLHSKGKAWEAFATNRNERFGRSSGAEGVLLWADAVCINQKDLEEQERQVEMMGEIYKRASKVMIWLGKEDAQSLEPIGKPRRDRVGLVNRFYLGLYGTMPICLSFIAQALKHADEGRNRLADMKPAEDSGHRNLAYGFPGPYAMEWEYLRDLFDKRWFQRVWVVQEVVLASQAIALIGDWEIQWGEMGRAAVWFHSKGYALPAVMKYPIRERQDFLPISKLVSVWELCAQVERRFPLLDLLREFRNREAKKPHDKIYATFGMAEGFEDIKQRGFDPLVKPSYKKPVVDVYRDVAKFLVIEYGNLQILSHAGEAPILSDWPSWVPDWREKKASNELSSSRYGDIYNADGNQALNIDLSRGANELSLQGIRFDLITAYDDRLKSHGFGFKTYDDEIKFVKRAWALFTGRPSHSPDPYATQDSTIGFVQTLTAGMSNTDKPLSGDPDLLDDALQWFMQYAPGLLPAAPLSQRLKWQLTNSPDSGRFHATFVKTCIDRKFFISSKGFMGIGPNAMKKDDVILILFGGKVPYVLRPSEAGYRFIGECYILGLMNGEAVDWWKENGRTREMFMIF
ncbi:hypothetical protein N0V83_009992 [Neocucurbitaria cava]|uniref:Heterokaryon incompatibility domain-containing protein n=1 Tax=Neocucurbitaria cava TaxID=798079 RepID=A0A9W9CGR8_9PLEO|nr:hypothetical protein N0V83_009992 [Neocucurbitaria cava]